jgi:hypothetical protein
MRYFYASAERWQSIVEAGQIGPTDKLTNDPGVPLDDDTRVRIAIRMRRDARQFVTIPAGRWHSAIDRVNHAILWERPMLVCSVSRSMVLVATPPPTCAGMK